MSLVGIIANPASGKDIRRLVAQAAVVNNNTKANIVARMLPALFAAGTDHVLIMPDPCELGGRALRTLANYPNMEERAQLIDMPVLATAQDTVRAASRLREVGAGCIVVLGGDRTCRDAAQGAGEVPILPISSGTNNVVPSFVEGTLAGLAAAFVAQRPQSARELLCYRHKALTVCVNGEPKERALVDVALLAGCFTGARAVWKIEELQQVFVTQAEPFHVGLSSLIGVCRPVGRHEPWGAVARVLPSGRRVFAPLMPGSLVSVSVGPVEILQPHVRYPVAPGRPAVLALDGEREFVLGEDDQADVVLDLDGPWIVDVEQCLRQAMATGLFESTSLAWTTRKE